MEPVTEPRLDNRQSSTHESSQLPESVLAGRRKLHEVASKLFSDDPNEHMETYLDYIGSTLQLDSEHIYTITDYVARGLTGAVFEVRDTEGKVYIMKLSKPFNRNDMHLALNGPIRDAKQKAERVHGLVIEVQNLRALENAYGEDSPAPALIDAQFVTHPDRVRDDRNSDIRVAVAIMEKVPGKDLVQMPTFTNKNAEHYVKVFIQLAAALSKLERAGVIHGDIGPQNILVTDSADEPQVRLIDFGGSVNIKSNIAHNNSLDAAFAASGDRIDIRPEDDNAPRHPVYGIRHGWHLTEGYAPKHEPPSNERDEYSLGKILEYYLFGQRFTRLSDTEKAMLALDSTPIKTELYNLAKDMTYTEPDKRIPMQEVLNRLKEIQEQLL